MKEILKQIAGDPLLEARWLNTLSLLEHIGSQKISKTVCEGHPSIEILEHRSDETRHAYQLALLAQHIDPARREYLCQDEALSYFHMLDQNLSEWISELTGISDSYQNYLLVTYMVEKRAMKLYPLYKKATENEEVRKGLDEIIHEESDHLHLMEKSLFNILKKHSIKSAEDLKTCFQIEETLFVSFFRALSRDIVLFSKAA